MPFASQRLLCFPNPHFLPAIPPAPKTPLHFIPAWCHMSHSSQDRPLLHLAAPRDQPPSYPLFLPSPEPLVVKELSAPSLSMMFGTLFPCTSPACSPLQGEGQGRWKPAGEIFCCSALAFIHIESNCCEVLMDPSHSSFA